MFSNNSRVLAWVKKPSQYNLRKIMTPEERKAFLAGHLQIKPNLQISSRNQIYGQAHQIIRKQKENDMINFEKSVLWSRRFTPVHFSWTALYAYLVLCLMLYIHYISQPKTMMALKKKYGIKLPELEAKGWLKGWMDEYRRPDPVLQFQAYNLKDMEKLYKEGLLTGGSDSVNKKQEEKAKRRKTKFSRGDKQFFAKDFKKV